jgi:hypothetical protein
LVDEDRDPLAPDRATILECWTPAEDLADLDQNIVGLVEVVAEFTDS